MGIPKFFGYLGQIYEIPEDKAIFAKVSSLFKLFLLKIAVNTRLLLPGKLEGIGWFSCETLQRICRQHPEHEFFFIFDRDFDERFLFASNITPIILFPQARHPLLY